METTSSRKKNWKKIAVEAGKSVQYDEVSEIDEDSVHEQVPNLSSSEDEVHISNEFSENSDNAYDEDMPEAIDATAIPTVNVLPYSGISGISNRKKKLDRATISNFIGNFLREKDDTKNNAGYISCHPRIKRILI
ncbi:hypothetical protein JTB14_001979 [Gonioctena quinquepunctata]|nr:hypothetical protein JTB14_001979 [Gonioctena quinquepunctata]